MELSPDALDELQIVGANAPDTPVMRFGFELMLGFDHGWQAATRRAVIAAAQGYAGAHPVNAFQRNGATRYSPIKGENYAEYYTGLVESDPDGKKDFSLVLADRDDATLPIPHGFRATLRPARVAGLEGPDSGARRSLLWAYWPASAALKTPGPLVETLLDWCNAMHPEQGSAGLAPVFARGQAPSHANEYFPFLKRFPGLHFLLPPLLAPMAGGIRTVNWLTILGEAYVDRLGGRAALEAALGAGIVLHDFDGGVLVQAGPAPELGDTNRGAWPELYRDANAALRPVRFEEYPNTPTALIKVPEPLDPYLETLDWVRRFDRE